MVSIMDKDERTQIWNALINLISQKTGFNNTSSLSRQSTLNRDIGLEGDDADEFMAAYFDHFKMDYGDYDWSYYFGEEGFNPISVLIDVIKRKSAPKPLTLGILELAAIMGKWDRENLEKASLDDNNGDNEK